MVQCSRYVPGKDPEGADIMVRCRGQVPNHVGNHVCPMCGAEVLVERQVGMGRGWSDNSRGRRQNMSRRARASRSHRR